MKVLISGASGMVGKPLQKTLQKHGHQVNILTRHQSVRENEFFWNPENGIIDEKAFQGISTIIHLSGASIGKKWTKNYKREIISSRVDTARLLFQTAERLSISLDAFISASGINYYGTFTSDKILTETDGILHHDFLSNVCSQWEDAALNFNKISKRTVILRTSPVLCKDEGTLASLKKIADLNLAAPIGTGKQWFNWIHVDDLVKMYINAVEDDEMKGTYNAVASEIPQNKDIMREIAFKERKLFIPVPVPKFMMKLSLGEMSEIISEGTRTSNQKILDTGYQFLFPTLDLALGDLL